MSSLKSSQQDQVHHVQGLAVFLQHPDIGSLPSIVCTLLQVCKSWRAVVKQALAGTVVAALPVAFSAASFAKLANFAAWLQQYPRFLRSITLSHTSYGQSMEDIPHYIRCAEDILSCSLQQAAEQQQLQLQSFSSDLVSNPAVLSVLPAATLSSLVLEYDLLAQSYSGEFVRANIAALPHVLQRLSNLQTLAVKLWSPSSLGIALPTSIQGSLGSLHQLSKLELSGVHRRTLLRLQHIPTQLCHLALVDSGVRYPNTPADVPLTLDHMRLLQSLHLGIEEPVPLVIGLPSQLTGLTVSLAEHSAIAALSITALKQLQELVIERSHDSLTQLLSLTGLAQLRNLGLQYTDAAVAEAACGAWMQLPSVCCLKLRLRLQPGAYNRVLSQVRGLVDLTELSLEMSVGQSEDPFHLVGYVGDLHKLRSLTASFSGGLPGGLYEQEVLTLTGLKHLTHLDLGGVGAPALDGSVACVLALHLTNLEYLSLGGAEISSNVMPVIGRLTKLSHLAVPQYDSQTQAHDALQFLTGLRALTRLSGFDEIARQEALGDFWLAVRGKKEYFDPYAYAV